MKIKEFKNIYILILISLLGCSYLGVTARREPITIEHEILYIEKALAEAEEAFLRGDIEDTRKFCDKAIFKLLTVEYALDNDEYERLQSEAAMLRIKVNHARHSQAYLIQSDLFPLVWNSRVEKWINYYTGRGRKYFSKWRERSRHHISNTKKILKEEGLPLDLAHVPIIESGYYPFARSKAGAVGMWQFMEKTAKLNGLKIDYWVDERMDPHKATYAACRLLKELYDNFGTWELALAAYNYGPNGVSRRIDKYGTEDYWELYLPRETEDFVPKIMAAIFIMNDPELFGFEPLEKKKLKYVEHPVNDSIDLRDVAKWCGTTLNDIQLLNPELKQMCTPPGQQYNLKIPRKCYKKFAAVYDSITDEEKYLTKEEIDRRIRRVEYYSVKSGDSLWKIAKKFSVTTSKLKSWNSLTENTIYPKQKLKIYRHGI